MHLETKAKVGAYVARKHIPEMWTYMFHSVAFMEHCSSSSHSDSQVGVGAATDSRQLLTAVTTDSRERHTRVGRIL